MFDQIKKDSFSLYALLFLFFSINLIKLMDFPVVHSDELWLMGLGNTMIEERSFWVTESFFDLYPRVIHPFRWVFHSIQIPFLLVLGSRVFSTRLISLIFSTLSLYVFYHIANKSLKSALLPTTTLALNIQFIYSARFARQEAIILCLMLMLYYVLTQPIIKPFQVSMLILLGIGVHPNSFMMGTSSLLLIVYLWSQKKITFKTILKMTLTGLLGALVYLIIGYINNPTLISSYLAFGAPLGTDALPVKRLEGFYWFWYKLYYQIGGTYDLFNIRWLLLLTPVALSIGIIRGRKSITFQPFLWLVGIFLGIYIIGRYNQTSVVFIIPWVILLVFSALDRFSNQLFFKVLVISILVYRLSVNFSQYDHQRFFSLSYEDMTKEISSVLPKDASILGNLNALEAFEGMTFFDIRNLAFMDQEGLSFEAYVRSRNISHIVWHDEMDYIYRNSPTWDFLYTHMSYMEEINAFLNKQTKIVHSFENPIYAMRISKYSGTYPFKTTIYQIIDHD